MKKKKFLVVLIIAVIIFVIAKIYCLTIIDDVYNAINKFRSEDNRYYSVSQTVSEISYKEEIFIKQPIIKYIGKNENVDLYYEWKNLETNEKYSFDANNKILDTKELSIWNEGFIKGLPNFVANLCENDEFNIASVIRVRYIIPTKYDNKPCYKVVTKAETIIIDKDTYLPVYSSIKTHNSDGDDKSKIEKTYEFEVGTVTDQDVLLPDLTNYTVVENLE